MEQEENTTYYGQCRCCLDAGNHRDITQDYYWNGMKEVYCDMFLDCFNVFMPTNINTCNLICESCVGRLRDAHSFKKMVLITEQQLMDALLSDNEPMMLVNVPVPKHTLDSTIGFKIKLSNVNDDMTKTKNVSKSLPTNIKDTTVPAFKIDGDILPKIELDDNEFETGVVSDMETENISVSKIEIEVPNELELLNEEIFDSAKTQEIEIPPDDVKNEVNMSKMLLNFKWKNTITEKMAHIVNVSTILECSNITAFKSKTKSGFPCFYCRNIFENFQSLREHQNKHSKSSLSKALKKYSAESLVVYADVTDLKCTLCDQDITNLKELKSHLVNTHRKQLFNKFTDRVVPFKLTENYYECQICNFYFETFGAIERHMNTHIRNYVCEKCGAGFITMLRLKTHVHSIHKEGKYPCKLCDKMFTTLQRYRGHVDFVHRMLKKLKCPKCPERFSDYFVQQKHLVEVHGETPIVYRCNVCSKAFNRRYTLSCHMKRRHLEQRDVCCQYCMYTCYTKTELREHMSKHNSVKMFECDVCRKTYSRKKTLRQHMRLHYGKRFVCSLCDQQFVHNNSLKIHMKVKHVD